MKKLMVLMIVFAVISAKAQKVEEINNKNSWLKIGLNTAVPVGDVADTNSFVLGVNVKGQYMFTPHFGGGLTLGYNNYFEKDEGGKFGEVPAGLFLRYYFKKEGLFVGADGGYGFITGLDDVEGGVYLQPQVGYHNSDWNIYGYYHHNFMNSDVPIDVQQVGIGASYNLKF